MTARRTEWLAVMAIAAALVPGCARRARPEVEVEPPVTRVLVDGKEVPSTQGTDQTPASPTAPTATPAPSPTEPAPPARRGAWVKGGSWNNK